MSIEETLRQIIREELQALKSQPVRDTERLLTVKEAGKMLGVSKQFMYMHAHEFPFTVVLSITKKGKRVMGFSASGVEKWLARRLKIQDARSSDLPTYDFKRGKKVA